MVIFGAAVAIIQDGTILLTQREDFEVWCLPGGVVDPRESAAQAAIREAREETGLKVELTRLVGVYSRLGLFNDIHVVLFAAKPLGGALRTQEGETIAVDYFSPDNLPEPLLFGYQQRIQDALNGVGGSVAWMQSATLEHEVQVNSRQELYDLRDQTGVSRQEFYRKHLISGEDSLEVG